MKRVAVWACVLCTAVCAGCASSGSGSAAVAGQTGRAADVITAAELATAAAHDAYGAVEQLRPTFLRARGQSSIGGATVPINVYVNGLLMGDASSLRQLVVSEIKEIRYLSPSDATMRFGTGNSAGAIVVTRK